MSLFGFNKRPIYRKFEYIPRYYDPAKEELEERLKKYEGVTDKSELAKSKIKSGLRSKYRVDAEYQSKVKSASNKKLFIIIGLLSIISYWVLTTESVINFLGSFL